MLFLKPAFKKLGWSGASTGNVTVWPASPMIIPGFKYLHVEGLIAGYTSTGIARVRFGTGTTVDTTNTCASGILEGATLNNTAINIPGIPLGVAAILGPRFFMMDIVNIAGIVKRTHFRADAGSVVAGTAPAVISGSGIWVNTSGQIQCIDIASYATLTATATGSQLTANTEFAVWGKDEL